MRPSVTQEATLLGGRHCGKGNCRECQSHIRATQKQLAIDGPYKWRGMEAERMEKSRYFRIHFLPFNCAICVPCLGEKQERKMVAGARKLQPGRLHSPNREMKRGESRFNSVELMQSTKTFALA